MEKNQKIFWGWYIVGGAFLVMAINYGARYCFGVFLKPMASEFGLSRSVISAAAAINMLVYSFCAIFVGRMRMLLNREKITKEMIAMLSTWRHSGFNVFCGNRISPKDETAMENLAHYIIRASFSQERMGYLEKEGSVVYRAKNGKDQKTFPAMDWLAAMCSHIPNQGEQMVRYYGYYSNVARGKRKAKGADDALPCILEPEGNSKTFRKNWARLIQKIYLVDPLICPKCKGAMRIISFIEDQQVIRDILTHLGLWLVRSRPPPKIHDPPGREDVADDLQIQPQSEIIYGDPEYSWDDYIQS